MTAQEPVWPFPEPDGRWIGRVAPAVGLLKQESKELARLPILIKPLQVCLSMLISLTFPLFGCLCRRRGRFLHRQLVQILWRNEVGGDFERCCHCSPHHLRLLVRPLDIHVCNADYPRIETQSGKEPAEIV